MKPRLLIPAWLGASLLLLPGRAHSGDTVTLHCDAARNHIGQSAVVKGVVAQASLGGKAVFLDFGAANPDQVFTAVSYDLPFSVLAAFQGQTVAVSGKIIGDRGKPEIVLSNLAQITVIHDPIRESVAGWPAYAPGQAPTARTLSLAEAGALAEGDAISERLYLWGEFRVTASGASRAVLRDARRPDDLSPRVVVEYPPGAVAPKEEERFVRDAGQPYLISEVRRNGGGMTIYVREIMAVEVGKK